MRNEDIIKIALRQSAVDLNCRPEDFLKEENVIVPSRKNEGTRAYLYPPSELNIVTYGANSVASVREDLIPLVREYIDVYGDFELFNASELMKFDDKLKSLGLRVTFMAEYFLPDLNRIKVLPCGYQTRILKPPFDGLYEFEWRNALCEKRKHLDVLAVGAYDGEKLVGLAGASADCEDMWQIGVDILPDYRRKGVASALTGTLTAEILKRGKVPFYSAAWSNIGSVKNALKCGYYPAWAEMTANSVEFFENIEI